MHPASLCRLTPYPPLRERYNSIDKYRHEFVCTRRSSQDHRKIISSEMGHVYSLTCPVCALYHTVIKYKIKGKKQTANLCNFIYRQSL